MFMLACPATGGIGTIAGHRLEQLDRLTECWVNINRQLSLSVSIPFPRLVVSLVDSERLLPYKCKI
jgi:hypothetical protein